MATTRLAPAPQPTREDDLSERFQKTRDTLWGVEAALRLLAESDRDRRPFVELLADNLSRENELLEEVYNVLRSKAVA